MKKTMLFIASVAAGMAVSCTDLTEIENRIDGLDNRVTVLEDQVNALNDNVKALQAFAQSGTTVASVEKTGNTYKITLGDGKSYEITAGETGSAAVPVIAIDSEGYWTVDGERLISGGEPVKATGEKGEPGAEGPAGRTPEFGVDSEGYWTVRFSEDEEPARVTGADGEPVKATGDKGDSFFGSVTVEDGFLKVSLASDPENFYSLPIVADFYCIIENAGDEPVVFDPLEEKTFTVSMKGVVSAKVDCPEGWTAWLDAPETADGNGTLHIAAGIPSVSTRSIIADSRKDVVVTACSATGAMALAKVSVSYFEVNVDISQATGFNLKGTAVNGDAALVQTLEDTDIFAFNSTLSAGTLWIEVVTADGVAALIVPDSFEDHSFSDAIPSSFGYASVTSAGTQYWALPSAEKYRIVLNRSTGKITFYSEANDLKPWSVEFPVDGNESNGVVRATITDHIYMYGNSWLNWTAKRVDATEISPADPQILYFRNKIEWMQLFNFKVGNVQEDFEIVTEGSKTNDLSVYSGFKSYTLIAADRSIYVQSPQADNKAVPFFWGEWIRLAGSNTEKGIYFYPANRVETEDGYEFEMNKTINEFILDLRNMRVKVVR